MLEMQGCSSGVEELSSGEAQFEAGSLHLALLLCKFLTSCPFSLVLIDCEWLGGPFRHASVCSLVDTMFSTWVVANC